MHKFADCLMEQPDMLVERWYQSWRSSPHPHLDLDEDTLKDHFAKQLRRIGEEILKGDEAMPPPEIWKEENLLDPEGRVIQLIPIEEVVHQYNILVQVIREWIEKQKSIIISCKEYGYFFQSIFELIAESVRRYAIFQENRIAKDRSEYLAGLTHQMRSPISCLSINLRLLKGSGQDRRQLAMMQRSVKRLSLLVNGVMRLERFKPDEIPVRPCKSRIARLVDEIIMEHEHDAHSKGLRFEISMDRTLEASIDPDLFADILGNLLQNAVKYTRRGFVRLEMREEEQHVIFTVKDSGPGISLDRQQALFSPIIPEKPGGVGIGLLIAHRAVLAQNGRIGIESDHGNGACIWFRLPKQVPAR